MTQQYYLDDTDVFLFKIIGLTVFFIVAMFITHGIVGLIHEGGHARACIVLGGNVGGFRHWLRGAWSLAPTTACSIKPLPPLVWAAGDIATIIGWFASVLILTLLLNRDIMRRGVCVSMLWGWWSFWSLGTLLFETYHAYSLPSVWEDSTQFIHVTGINPNLIGLPLATILAISLWPWWRVQYRLLPDLVLSNWDRLRTSLTSKYERSPLSASAPWGSPRPRSRLPFRAGRSQTFFPAPGFK